MLIASTRSRSHLRSAITRSGGLLHILKAPPSDPLSQALELRALMQDAHVVVLHIFPYDVIPILALATGCDAKTVYVNHSDHTFWLGASVSPSGATPTRAVGVGVTETTPRRP